MSILDFYLLGSGSWRLAPIRLGTTTQEARVDPYEEILATLVYQAVLPYSGLLMIEAHN